MMYLLLLNLTSTIYIDGYVWFGNNRTDIDFRAVRGSGGVGILIKEELLELFNIEAVDATYEGILWIKLIAISIDTPNVKICACYLPPHDSSRGNTCQEFLDNLTAQTFMFADDDPMLVCGDLNARIGNTRNYCDMLDTIPDLIVNNHGHSFLNYLCDANLCVANGRGDPTKDNYTSASHRGKSVVDYIAHPYEQLSTFSNFNVCDTLCRYDITPNVPTLPDHSILSGYLVLSEYTRLEMAVVPNMDRHKQRIHPTLSTRKYQADRANTRNMFCSPSSRRTLIEKPGSEDYYIPGGKPGPEDDIVSEKGPVRRIIIFPEGNPVRRMIYPRREAWSGGL